MDLSHKGFVKKQNKQVISIHNDFHYWLKPQVDIIVPFQKYN